MNPEEQDKIDGSERYDGDLNTDELNEMIESICASKAEEFGLMGYDNVTGEDVWLCVSEKYRKTGTPQLHAIVNDILSLKVTQYMNFLTMRMYRQSE